MLQLWAQLVLHFPTCTKVQNCSSLNNSTFFKSRILGEFDSYVCMLPDILIMMKSFPLGFHLLWASISSRFPSPGPLRMEDRICRQLNLRSKALAELRAKVAFQCHRSPLNAFTGALQDWNLHGVTTWNWRMSCSYQESQSNRRKLS